MLNWLALILLCDNIQTFWCIDIYNPLNIVDGYVKQPVYVEASDGGAYKTFSRGNEVEACVEDEIW